MKAWFKTAGQVGLTTIIIGGMFTLLASIGGSWMAGSASAQKQISAVNTKVEVVQERENNHYRELKEDLKAISRQLQVLIDKSL